MPVIVDFRAFRFNTTTFDYCIKEGYNLEYPPVIHILSCYLRLFLFY